ncbi:hypothetical protein E4U21_002801 [Claviceps maximensis]|nr:hypothetical protein E4U21_002801 [Claviceps maximensis]
MTVQSGPCWNYPVSSMATPSDPVTFTTVGFPVSPRSITTTTMSSPPPNASFPFLTRDVVPRSCNRNRGRRHHSKMSTPSSSLPNPKELSIEDDWTRVKCPKEKKRIQNRVAQRTYRHRMKARLGELQARLDSHERQRMEQIAHSTSDVPNSEAISSGHANLYTNLTNSLGSMDGEPESTFYPHNGPYLHSPPNSHSSPQAPNGLLSPPGRAEFEKSCKVSQGFGVDCLRVQSQVPNSSLPQVMGSMSRDELGFMSGLAPAHGQNLDFSFDGSRDDDWRTDAFGLRTRSCPSPMAQMSFGQISGHAGIPGPESMLWKDDGSCRTEERVERAMQHVRDTGFETFEDFATSYYKTNVSKSSGLSTEQQLSLATMLLQRCSGTVSREQLLRVVEACI